MSPTNWIPLLRLYLLEGVDLSRQVTLNDVGEGGQQLGVQGEESTWFFKLLDRNGGLPHSADPRESVIGAIGRRAYGFPHLDAPIPVTLRKWEGGNDDPLRLLDLGLVIVCVHSGRLLTQDPVELLADRSGFLRR